MDIKIEIKNDVFNIAKRVKQIDKGYFILYNLTKKFFELHNKNQYRNTFCLTFYGDLDCSLIDKILESDIRNAKNIFENIEKENEKINREVENKRKVVNEYKLKEIFDYAKNNSKQIKAENIFTSDWL